MADGAPVAIGEAVERFLIERQLAPGSRTKYRATLAVFVDRCGARRPLADVDPEVVAELVRERWDRSGPATWNRHVATLRSFFGYCRRQGWCETDPTGRLERRREPLDQTRAVPVHELEALWRRRDVPLRERALWRLLYESAARANEILGLDVDDVDLENRRATVIGKGGHREIVHFQTGAARLLSRLLRDRRAGPVFLASRRPARAAALTDLCTESGRSRLSYRRAEELFHTHTDGRTLHQLRHTALTELAAANVSLPLLMAKSRHHSLRSLQRYARPGPDAVAALTARLDPARRR